LDNKMKDAIRSNALSRTLRWVLLWLQLCMGESRLITGRWA
jgi:hypothetical protein